MTAVSRRALATVGLALPWAARAQGDAVPSEAGALRLSTLAEGLERPWGAAFLPDGRLLVTERPGRLRLVGPNGAVSPPLPGLPPVEAQGQGGLLDILLAPDFASTREVFLTCSALLEGGALTRLLRARLAPDASRLTDAQPILDCGPPQARGRLHFGGRMAFSADGRHLFLTSGDRNEERERAQRLDDLAGKVIRLDREGRIPADNPFANRPGARAEIWTYGHRNPQGIAALPGTGRMIAAEMGPRGGDEVNLLEPGRNFGWPLATFGREYWGGQIAGGRTEGPGLTQPLRHWTPSVSPSGIAFAPSNATLPGWRNSLFLACLNPAQLVRLTTNGPAVTGEERLLQGGPRLRHALFAPDGALLLLTDEARGRVLRLAAG